jgi:hypothetical protein
MAIAALRGVNSCSTFADLGKRSASVPEDACRLWTRTDLSALDLAVLALAAHRLTRLVTSDDLLDAPRTAVVRRLGARPNLADAVRCDWCVGAWVSAAVVLAGSRWPAARRLAAIPALSSVVGLLSTLDSTLGRAFQPQSYADPAKAVEYPRVVR